MPTIQEVTQDPEFKAWPREKQLYMLGKADPEFGTYEPEKQNYFINKFVKDEHKPSPLTAETMGIKPVEQEQEEPQGTYGNSGVGKFFNKFQPSQILGELPGLAVNYAKSWAHPLDRISDTAASMVDPTGIGRKLTVGGEPKGFVMPILEGMYNKSKANVERGWQKYQDAGDSQIGKLLAGVEAGVGAIPLVNESLDAGRKMIPPSGNFDLSESGSMLADLANAALPLGVEKGVGALAEPLSNSLKNSGARNIENIFKAGTDKAGYANVEDLSKKIMGGKYDVLAPSDEALMNKLDVQKTSRLAPNKAIESELAETPIGPKGKLTALEPIDNFIKEQGENPTFANKERVGAANDAKGQLNSLFEEQQKAPGNALEFDENGNPVSQRPTTVPRNPKFKDILETKQSASETADKHDYFDRSGPGFDEAKAAKGQSAGKVAQGTRQALEESVTEHAQPTNMPDGFNIQKSPIKGSPTVSIKGPNGEKLALKELPDRINMETIGKGKAANSKQTVDAMRAYGQQTGKPVYISSTSLTADAGKFYENMLKRGEMIETPEGYLLKGTGESAPNSDWLKYGERNAEAADLIDMKKMVGRQKTIGTMGLPKYVLQRMGSAFGLRAAGAEEASRLAGSTAYQSGMAYSKKTLADMLMGQGMPENAANAAALKIITANSSR